MINATAYLKENGDYPRNTISNFLRMERVKYMIANGESVEAKRGRHGGYTLFSEHLFEIFILWLQKKPIPLLNRKEYEVSEFIVSFFGSEVVRQYKLDNLVYDWFIPSKNLPKGSGRKAPTRTALFAVWLGMDSPAAR